MSKCMRCGGGKGGSINPREAELLSAAKGMDQVIDQILREHGRTGPATDWGIVNAGMVRLGKAVAAYNTHKEQK